MAMSPTQNAWRTAELRARGIFTGRVLSNDSLCPEHYRIRIGLESFPPTRPGQFINIRCGGYRGRVPLLRRPFSLAGRRDASDGSVELDILYRVVGAGTAWLAGLETDAQIDLIGPLGNGFAIREDKPQAALVGGGTGIGPMIYLAEALAAAGRAVAAFAGARTASTMPLIEKQKETFAITTDDGSMGHAGMVHEAFSRWLDNEKPRPAELVVYACGPEAMMKAVADICTPDGIECQLAMERHMACGMGTCQGCAIKVKTDEPPGWMFKLVCKDGPVFDAEELVWE